MILLRSRTVTVALVLAGVCLSFSSAALAKKDKKEKRSASEGASSGESELYGKPKQLDAGNRRGLYVWCAGERWHVVSATRGELHVFTGMVHVKGGKVTNVANFGNLEVGHVPLMYRSHVPDIGAVNPARDMITFKFTTKGARDGFTFTVDEAATELEVRILRDGMPIPGEVFIGSNGTRPPAAAFSLPAHPKKHG